MKEVTGKYSVYKITSPDNKTYIGCTSMNPKDRWDSGHGYKTNKLLWADICKFGWNAFDRCVIHTNLTEDEAYEMERNLISHYNSTDPKFGYNKSIGGKGPRGVFPSEETRRKLSESRMGEKNHFYGKHHTEEAKYKISIAHSGENHYFYGKHLSDEHRRKIGDGNRGKHLTEEQRIRNRIYNGANRKVRCIDTGVVYNSISEAARVNNCDRTGITDACRGKLKTSNGLRWEYV